MIKTNDTMPFKIALLGIFHESNTFVTTPTKLENFKDSHLLKGTDIRSVYRDAHHEIGGMIEVLDEEGMELVPVMYAEATPGGTVSADTYDILLEEMFYELNKVLPVDACLVVPHGAGVSESYPDMDGHWLSRLRELLGNDIPVIGTLDPHANVSQLMVSSTNALIAYSTNPHIDQRETGRKAARLLVRTLREKLYLSQLLVQLPLAISIEQQYTGKEPCKSLFAYAASYNNKDGIFSVSVLLGFPYADVEEMGSSVIIVSDGSAGVASAAGEKIASYVVTNKEQFVGDKLEIANVLVSVENSKKPVLMLDMGDNVGGGSPGNSTYLFELLHRNARYTFFICLYNPAAVIEAMKYSVGDRLELALGDGSKLSDNTPVQVRLSSVSEGKFQETTPRHGGQVYYDMGNIAIVQTESGGTVMLTSLRVPPFSLQQLTSFGIDPVAFDVVIAKGVNAPIAAYAPLCPTIIQVNTPGLTQADMTLFQYKNRRRPLFPFENNIELNNG